MARNPAPSGPERAEVIVEVAGHDDVFKEFVFTLTPLKQAMPVDSGLPYEPNDSSTWVPAAGGYVIVRNLLVDRTGQMQVWARNLSGSQRFSSIANYAAKSSGSYLFRVTAKLKNGSVLNERRSSVYIDGGQTDVSRSGKVGVELSGSGKAGPTNLSGKANFGGEYSDKTTGPRTVQRTDTTTRTEGPRDDISSIMVEPRAHLDALSLLTPALMTRFVG